MLDVDSSLHQPLNISNTFIEVKRDSVRTHESEQQAHLILIMDMETYKLTSNHTEFNFSAI